MNGVKRLLEELSGVEPMPRQEAKALALTMREAQSSDPSSAQDARHALVLGNLRLVLSLAKLYRGRGLGMSELIAHGTIGLAKAIDHYDPSSGYALGTYAAWWVRQALARALADHARAIRLPAAVLEQLQMVARTRRELSESSGREPTEDELAEASKVSRKRLEQLRTLPRVVVSLGEIEADHAGVRATPSESSSTDGVDR